MKPDSGLAVRSWGQFGANDPCPGRCHFLVADLTVDQGLNRGLTESHRHDQLAATIRCGLMVAERFANMEAPRYGLAAGRREERLGPLALNQPTAAKQARK